MSPSVLIVRLGLGAHRCWARSYGCSAQRASAQGESTFPRKRPYAVGEGRRHSVGPAAGVWPRGSPGEEVMPRGSSSSLVQRGRAEVPVGCFECLLVGLSLGLEDLRAAPNRFWIMTCRTRLGIRRGSPAMPEPASSMRGVGSRSYCRPGQAYHSGSTIRSWPCGEAHVWDGGGHGELAQGGDRCALVHRQSCLGGAATALDDPAQREDSAGADGIARRAYP